MINYQIGPNRLTRYLPPMKEEQVNQLVVPFDRFGELIWWEGKKIIILKEELNNYSISRKIQTDFLVLSNDQFINFDKTFEIFDVKQVIIDSTYSKYKASYISKKLKEYGIKHWNVLEEGALVYSI